MSRKLVNLIYSFHENVTLSTATPCGKSSCRLAAHALGGLLTSSVPTLKDLKGQRWEEGCLTMGLYCGIRIMCKHKNCEHKVNWNWAWKFSNEDTLCITKTSRISMCRENMKFVANITRMQNDVPRKLCALPIEVANQVTGED